LGLQDEFALCMAAGIGVAVYPIVDYNIPAKLPEFRDLVIINKSFFLLIRIYFFFFFFI
jgi:hypothetical protein